MANKMQSIWGDLGVNAAEYLVTALHELCPVKEKKNDEESDS